MLKRRLAEEIAALADAGYTDFLTGMAEGTDIWAALAVLDFREKDPALKLHCILPCSGQEEQWSPSAQELYRAILKQANSVVYVSQEYHKNCMLERNRYLVEKSSCLIAVYNGEWRGGTAATVRYAK